MRSLDYVELHGDRGREGRGWRGRGEGGLGESRGERGRVGGVEEEAEVKD